MSDKLKRLFREVDINNRALYAMNDRKLLEKIIRENIEMKEKLKELEENKNELEN